MKKLMLAIAVAFAAVAVNAAAFKWTMTGVQDSPVNTAAAGWAVYFLGADDYAGALAAGGEGIVSFVTDNYMYQDATSVVTSRKGSDTVANSAMHGTYTQGMSESGFLVIFDAAAPADAKYYAMTGVLTSGAVTALNNDINVDFGTFTTGTTATQGWAEIAPEPTSGLMMLLGMGVLALRRRRA